MLTEKQLAAWKDRLNNGSIDLGEQMGLAKILEEQMRDVERLSVKCSTQSDKLAWLRQDGYENRIEKLEGLLWDAPNVVNPGVYNAWMKRVRETIEPRTEGNPNVQA